MSNNLSGFLQVIWYKFKVLQWQIGLIFGCNNIFRKINLLILIDLKSFACIILEILHNKKPKRNLHWLCMREQPIIQYLFKVKLNGSFNIKYNNHFLVLQLKAIQQQLLQVNGNSSWILWRFSFIYIDTFFSAAKCANI